MLCSPQSLKEGNFLMKEFFASTKEPLYWLVGVVGFVAAILAIDSKYDLSRLEIMTGFGFIVDQPPVIVPLLELDFPVCRKAL